MREADVQLGCLHRRLGRLDRRLRGVVRADVVVELALGDRALFGQRTVAGEIPLGLRELRAALGEVRLRLGQRALERPPVDFEQHLAFADERAFAVIAFDEIARHLRPNLGVDVAVERRNPLTGELDPLGGD